MGNVVGRKEGTYTVIEFLLLTLIPCKKTEFLASSTILYE